MKKKINVMIAGLGDFGFSWLSDIVLNHDRVNVAGLVSKNQSELAMARKLGKFDEGILFTDIAEGLKVVKPDFIINATPPGVHNEINMAAFNNSIPVLCEKPIAETLIDSKKVLDQSEKSGVPFMISENYRYTDLMRMTRKMILSDDIGQLSSIDVNFQRKHKMDNYHKDLQHPLLLDVSIHHFDLMRYLTGVEVVSVYAKAWTPSWSWYHGYSTAQIMIEMGSMIHVSYRGSLSSHCDETEWMGDWRIEGEKGIIRITGNTICMTNDFREMKVEVNESCDSRKMVLDEFIDSLDRHRIGETDIKDNMKTFMILDAAIRSAENGEVCRIPVNSE